MPAEAATVRGSEGSVAAVREPGSQRVALGLELGSGSALVSGGVFGLGFGFGWLDSGDIE